MQDQCIHFLKALKAFELSFYIEDLLMNGLVYENSKILMQLRSRNRTEKCISIYKNLYSNPSKVYKKILQLSEHIAVTFLNYYASNYLFGASTSTNNDFQQKIKSTFSDTSTHY